MENTGNEQLQIHRPQVEIQVNKQEELQQGYRQEDARRQQQIQSPQQVQDTREEEYRKEKVAGVQKDAVVFDRMQAHPLEKEKDAAFHNLLATSSMHTNDMMQGLKNSVREAISLTQTKLGTGESAVKHVQAAKNKYVEVIRLGEAMLQGQQNARFWSHNGRSASLVEKVVEKAKKELEYLRSLTTNMLLANYKNETIENALVSLDREKGAAASPEASFGEYMNYADIFAQGSQGDGGEFLSSLQLEKAAAGKEITYCAEVKRQMQAAEIIGRILGINDVKMKFSYQTDSAKLVVTGMQMDTEGALSLNKNVDVSSMFIGDTLDSDLYRRVRELSPELLQMMFHGVLTDAQIEAMDARCAAVSNELGRKVDAGDVELLNEVEQRRAIRDDANDEA